MTPMLVSQAEFARLRGVSGKTVTQWKHEGRLVLQGAQVDVHATWAALASQNRQKKNPPPPPPPLPQPPPGIVNMASSIIDGSAADIAITLRRHLPMATVRPLVEEIIADMRRGSVEVLDNDSAEGEFPLPEGMRSWAQHPYFTEPPLTEAEWIEVEVEAEAKR